jgi:hypothetical protein
LADVRDGGVGDHTGGFLQKLGRFCSSCRLFTPWCCC